LACFLTCGCFGNMCTCTLIYCVLYCLYCVFVLFRLCIFIIICFVYNSVRTTATECQIICVYGIRKITLSRILTTGQANIRIECTLIHSSLRRHRTSNSKGLEHTTYPFVGPLHHSRGFNPLNS